MLIIMIVAIPMYVCATASVPVAAALMLNGITPGAAFVFLMAGPATNAAAIAAVWKALGGKVALLYLILVAVLALIFGFTIDYLFSAVKAFGSTLHAEHSGIPFLLKSISAVILFIMIIAARVSSLWTRK